MSVCETKVAYDTEWEAERAASITGHRLRTEMGAYKCKHHWHIYHLDGQQRLTKAERALRKDYCVACKQHMKLWNYKKHLQTPSHINRLKRIKEKGLA